MDLFLIIATVAAAMVAYLLLRCTTKKSLRLPPGPRGLPIIGNLHQMEKFNPQQFFFRLSKLYGPIFTMKLGSRHLVMISSAELAKELLKTQDLNFTARPLLKGQQTMSYQGRDLGFGQYTAYYREMRKMCMVNLFSPNRVASFLPVREEECQRMMDKIYKAVDQSGTVDLSELLLSFTNCVVCRQAFGKRYNESGAEMRRFISILFETQAFLGTLFFSDLFPYFGFVDNLTGLNARLKKAFKELDTYLQELLDETLDPNRPKPERESFIDLLMTSHKDQPFSVEFTHENVKAMIFEVRNVVGNKGYVSEEDIPNLPYLKAVIKESLRLELVIPILLPRETIADAKIGGYDIPAKTMIQVNSWAVSRDTAAFMNEKKGVDFKGQDFELLPFGSGRRMCPAMHLRVAAVEIPFTNLLYRFDWSLPKGVKSEDINIDVMPGLAMHKKDPLVFAQRSYI
ncbi:hypothetical protein EUTSA_v10010978mg [Eutrema salsugineum]|uniref:Cytochrome P450 n=1 Tax=Eutrema salsugineum TaxID=72664 RepID=V4L6E9_EUTSA|nr:hypothetical protein EUTSA_v10010978mg [Eutrema salsugineum]